MIYVGIDIANLNHFIPFALSDREVLVTPFEFLNDAEGFRSLSLVVARFERDNLLIVHESMAHHGNNLVEFFFSP